MKKGTEAIDILRVLLIDDDEALSAAMANALDSRGILAGSIRPVASAPLADVVGLAIWFKPHAILMDVVMPVDTGRLVEVLRARPELAGTRIYGCSGHASLADRYAGKLDGFLHKPFGLDELVQTVTDEPRNSRPPEAKAPASRSTKKSVRPHPSSTR